MTQQYIDLLQLAGKFKEAVEAKIQGDPALIAKVQDVVSSEEMEELQNLMGDVMEIAMGMAFGGTPSAEELVKLTQFEETFTGVAERILPEAELKALLPEGLKDDAAAAGLLEANNAPRLARLCKPVLA